MKDQRKPIVRRPKSPLSVYIQSQLDRSRRNRPFVCGFFKSGLTCSAGDECPLLHTFPRNSNAHRTTTCLSDLNPDPGAHRIPKDAEQVGGSNLFKQNKDGGEDPSCFQRGFGSSELLGGCLGFDGRRRRDAGIGGSNLGNANAVGWGRANDGVSSWGKEHFSGGGWCSQNNYGGGGGQSWSSLGDGGSIPSDGRGFSGSVNWGSWDFDSKNEETNAGEGWETNTVDDDDAWGYKPNAGASSSNENSSLFMAVTKDLKTL